MRYLAIYLICSFSAYAAEVGKVCDRHGVVLMEVERGQDGQVSRRYPFKAFAAHLLHDLTVLPETGETIYLTIDCRVQMAAEKALRSVPRGCAVVVDPLTGDVLAMASVPSFDPGAMDEKSLQADETEPLRNRAATAYAPGATFLPVTALAGLSKGLRDFSYDCTGQFPVGRKILKCWKADRGSSHGPQTLLQGMKNSCNTFFYAYGIATGPEAIFSTAEVFGFGERTGLPLRNEEAGLVSLKQFLAKESPRETWSDGYTATTAIGQGMLTVTPLQMVSFAANLADGGDPKKLRLVYGIERADGRASREGTRLRGTLDNAGLRQEDLEIVREAMRATVAPGGNAPKGAIPGFDVAARTGTAQSWRNGQRDSQTWFIGFAQSEKVRYAFGVMVQGAKSGGGIAAPIAARIVASAHKDEAETLEPATGSFDPVWELPPEE